MTLKTALALLAQAPAGDGPSRLSPYLTEAQAVQIVRNACASFGRPMKNPLGLDEDIHPLMAKNVQRVCGAEHQT